MYCSIVRFSLMFLWLWCGCVGQTFMLQPPPLPLLSRLYSSFCSLCVQILPAACIHCTHSVSCVWLYFCRSEKRERCMCVCVWQCLSQRNVPLLPEVTVHMCVFLFHCVESQQTITVLSTGFCILSWRSTDQQMWQKLTPVQWTTFRQCHVFYMSLIHWWGQLLPSADWVSMCVAALNCFFTMTELFFFSWVGNTL